VDILYQIRTRRDQLSPIQIKIADAILDDIAFAASASIDQLAEKAGVSTAGMSRFAKAMECEDIRDLRMKLAQASAVGSRFLSGDIPSAETSVFYGNIVSDIERTLQRHLAAFEESRFKSAVQLLAKARRIFAFGMGGASTVFSDELQFRLVRLGYLVASYHDPVLMRIAASTMNSGDVLVVLSTTGITPELLPVLSIAKDYGASIIAISREATPIADMATIVLPLLLDETDFIYKPTAARYGMVLAVDILATELALLAPENSQELLRRVKLALDDNRGGEDRLPLGD
jgi:RpiR family carbohydrate utilization transcriptional regulator